MVIYGKKSHISVSLFSGGQDSSICLAWALDNYDYVETIGFNYGQRHIVEMEARKNIINAIKKKFPNFSKKIGTDTILEIDFIKKLCKTSLTEVNKITYDHNNIPSTFVPGRNLLFLTAAASLCFVKNINVIIGGMCESDFSNYPDCTERSVISMENALKIGLGNMNLKIQTPLMHINKAYSWKLAYSIGKELLVNIILEYSHTCYLGDRSNRYEWGYGCGKCPACILRRNGWIEWNLIKKH
ncbi:7-cyano-7-deazaguanine synthase [Candidatus Kinetoplastibacterium sorsogonicusi]|uniref:7-cyano-7-deazaguanine synthase n=1 Tax=Candidatus Kinetoplastidibacterium kentomonadis TaxID=1576550 RepID=A0A3Q8EWP7_9PROT|nr:7-cyano-7-deazaguanine synthase QueC [Candidatus Kinetoplastibacterium sorsogonicusi]AWD32219.1 7-cyano-7-deazaguanine synthase [Candidatus Kinetoplastibacterium sorsogonicusi]